MKPYNCVIFELAYNHSRDALIHLQNIRFIKIVKWLGNNDDASGVISTYYSNVLNIDELQKESVVCHPSIYEKVYKRLYVFLDMVSRGNDLPIYEKVNMFNLYIDYYYGMFSKNKIDLVIFGDIPHFGVDSVAYDVAKAMNIPCILTLATHEANRFWCVNSIEDIGCFDSIKNNDLYIDKVEESYEKYVFNFLKNIKEENSIVTEYNLKRYFSLIFRRWQIGKFSNIFNRGIKFIFRMRQERIRELEYLDEVLMHTVNKVDLSKKYIYFPLQLQPEQSTSALGGKFCDQILAIERLLKLLPDNWYVYVKENPRQTYYMRQKMFFHRLSLLKNVLYVSKDEDTHQLINNAQFVATITGSVGWEAISVGKCAVVFGYAWYRKLPGVFEYSSDLTLQEILDYKVDIIAVKNEYKDLIKKSFKGVMQIGWTQDIVKNYSDKSNVEYLKVSLMKIIGITMGKMQLDT